MDLIRMVKTTNAMWNDYCSVRKCEEIASHAVRFGDYSCHECGAELLLCDAHTDTFIEQAKELEK